MIGSRFTSSMNPVMVSIAAAGPTQLSPLRAGSRFPRGAGLGRVWMVASMVASAFSLLLLTAGVAVALTPAVPAEPNATAPRTMGVSPVQDGGWELTGSRLSGRPFIAAGLATGVAPVQDTIRLADLQEAAVQHDPRARQLLLQDGAATLRLRNVAAEWMPELVLGGQATHQSEVPRLPVAGGGAAQQPPKDRYELTLDARQLLWDGGVLDSRRALEESRLRAERARLAVELYPLRSEVNRAFFQGFLLQERLREAVGLIEELESRLETLRAQVREGVALPGDTAVMRSELLRVVQRRNAAAADRRAALAVLSALIGRSLDGDVVQELPELADAVAATMAGLETRMPVPPTRGAAGGTGALAAAGDSAIRLHPRFAAFAAQREQLELQSSLLHARTRPQLFAFGQLGYGRPGLQQFTDDFHDYWIAGLRVRWQPWNRGVTSRERELLHIQQQVIDTEEGAFAALLTRQVQGTLETIEHLDGALVIDAEIIALREQVERQARAQLSERAINPAEYVTVRTALGEARIALQLHRVELAQARAQYLAILGVPLR